MFNLTTLLIVLSISSYKSARLIIKTRILNSSLVIFLSGIMLIGIIGSSGTDIHAQSHSHPRIFAVGKGIPVELELKAIQQGEKVTKIKGFDITIDNVVQANQDGTITAFSQGPQITKAKVRTGSAIENSITLVPLSGQQNTFSLRGLASGVYVLDIIAKDGRRDLAYETILVILAPGQTTTTTFLQPGIIQIINNIITKVKTESDTDIRVIVIKDQLKCPNGYERKGDECKPKPCPKGQTGTPPDCKPEPICPKGQTGTPPDCKPDPCIENPNAEGCPPPDCEKNPDLPQCQADPCDENPDLPQCQALFNGGECPEGQTGTPPNCEPTEPTEPTEPITGIAVNEDTTDEEGSN